MSTYPLDRQFRLLRRFQIPLYRPLCAPLQGAMRAFIRCRGDRNVEMRRVSIPGRNGNAIRTVILSPRGTEDETLPCLVFFHGGGFIMAAAPHHYALAREYAWRANCRVVFPDYRLAPKHPFPAAAHDCADAYRWTAAHAAELKIDPERIAVGGDSAGGDLAAVTAQMARDLGWPAPVFQLLIYPVTDRGMQTESAKQFRDTPLWNTALSEKMWAWYLPEPGGEPVCYASPIEAADFSGLAPAYVEVADFDALRDEGLAYADALQRAGVPVTVRRTKGTPHGFEVLTRAPITRAAVDWRCEALRGAFWPET